MAASPFMNTGSDDRSRCQLCNEHFITRKMSRELIQLGFTQSRNLEMETVDMTLCLEPRYSEFQLARSRLWTNMSLWWMDKSFRITFRNRLKHKETQSGQLHQSNRELVAGSSDMKSATYRLPREPVIKEDICFVCDMVMAADREQ